MYAPAPKADHTIASGEINTIFARTAMATPTDDDKAYLAQLVSDQTGLSAQDAMVRVDQAYTSIDKAKADAAQAAELRGVSVCSQHSCWLPPCLSVRLPRFGQRLKAGDIGWKGPCSGAFLTCLNWHYR